jgi:hypothetical protein
MTAGSGRRQTYAPTAARVGAAVFGLAALWWAGELALSGDLRALVRSAPWLMLGCVVVYAVFWRPDIAVDDAGVRLRNPVRDVTIPWAELDGIDTRFALTLVTRHGRHQSWAAAAPGRPGLLQRTARQGEGDLPAWMPDSLRAQRASSDLRADSGAAAFLVEQRWAAWRLTRAGGDAGGQTSRAVVRWNAALAATATLLLLSGVAAIVLA